EVRSAGPGPSPLPERGGGSARDQEEVEVSSKAAGASQPRRRIRTGPAKPRRSVCAPMALAFSLYRRPVVERRSIMWFSSWLRNQTSNRAPKGRAQHRPPRFRPRLEALEDRSLPSTLTVLNSADSGPGSLRAEITAAQNGDTIVFDPSLAGQTINLT